MHPLTPDHLTWQLANNFPYHTALLIKLLCRSDEGWCLAPSDLPLAPVEAPGRRGADALGWSCADIDAVLPLAVILILVAPKNPLPWAKYHSFRGHEEGQVPKTSSLPGTREKQGQETPPFAPWVRGCEHWHWRDITRYNILETRAALNPPHALAVPSCLHTAVRIQMGHIHSGLKSSSGFALNLWGSQWIKERKAGSLRSVLFLWITWILKDLWHQKHPLTPATLLLS